MGYSARIMLVAAIAAGLGAVAGGCSKSGDDELPPPICNAGTHWTPGTQAFREATVDWGLDQIGAVGVRLAAVDYDGDGWADLAVRSAGNAPNDFTPGGTRTTWLLHNNGAHAFVDVTQASGLWQNRNDGGIPAPDGGAPNMNTTRGAEVIAFADVDNDGDLDAFTGLGFGAPGRERSELMINQGDGTFALGPADSPLRGIGFANASPGGASFVDFDRDGRLDVWIPQTAVNSNPQQDRLFQGDGAGGFVDVTIARGLQTEPWGTNVPDLNQALGHVWAWSAAACDLNNDGNPELLSASYARAPNHLWLNTGPSGAFTFTNQSVGSGYAYDNGTDWSDNESARCWCQLHPTDNGCAGVPPPQYIPCTQDSDAFRWDNASGQELWQLGGNSAATLCADVDNDGWMDLVTGEIRHWDVGSSSDQAELMVNNKDPGVTFTRPGNDHTGLARQHPATDWDEGIMTGAVFDFDNDGWPDLYWGDSDYPGTHGLLFHQDAPGHFEAVPIADGIDQHRSHGVVVADFDHDGDLDIVVGHSLARCSGYTDCYPTGQIRFFENVTGQDGNFVQMTLTGGPGSNRAAIGARVTVTAGGITQTRDVEGGHGHFGMQDDLTLHFGLGAACEAEVTVRWPDADLTTENFKLPAGYRFAIVQGAKPKVLWAARSHTP